MIFEAKKDKFFSTIFYLIVGGLTWLSIYIFKSISTTVHWWGFALIIVSLLLVVWIWYGTQYKINNNILNIVSGPFKINIPIRTITKVQIGKTMWIGYKLGLSKNGLIIHYNKHDEIYISPENAQNFVNTLKRIHSEIEIAQNID